MRYMDAPDAWEAEIPPRGCEAVPIASMDVMSYSYSCRSVLAEISRMKNQKEDERLWAKKSLQVLQRMKEYLWDEAKGAYFDKDKHHRQMPILIHNTLRTMYWGSITQKMADRFVKEHLCNPNEFWTRLPLPSVAVNDPMFRNVTTNNWSGQVEALTYQRAIRALEKYGYYELLPKLGNKLFKAIGENCVFVQQYDPFTSVPSSIALEGEQDAYGPAMLSVLEYISRMYGVHIDKETICWGSCGKRDTEYEQEWNNINYRIVNDGAYAEAFLNGKKIFSVPSGKRVITDYRGNILNVQSLEDPTKKGLF